MLHLAVANNFFPLKERERERVVLILCSKSVKFTSARLTFGGCMPPNINTE